MREKSTSVVDLNSNCQYEFKMSSVMTMRELFTIITEEGKVHLDVTISADFENVPEKYRELFINMLTSKYMNTVSMKNNVFSKKVKEKNQNVFEKLFMFFKKYATVQYF